MGGVVPGKELQHPAPPEFRCHGKVRSKDSPNYGQQCPKYALKGTKLCHHHGGRASHHQKAAARRIEREKVLARAAKMIPDDAVGVEPAQALMDALNRAYSLTMSWGICCEALNRASEHLQLRGKLHYEEPTDELDILSLKTNEQLIAFNRHGEAQIHPFVEEYNKAVDRQAKMSEMCLKAGIAERKVKLAEQQGHLMVRVIRGIVNDLEGLFGITMTVHPEFPGIVRRNLALASGGDVVIDA